MVRMIDGLIRDASFPIKIITAALLRLVDNILLKYGILKGGRLVFIIARKIVFEKVALYARWMEGRRCNDD